MIYLLCYEIFQIKFNLRSGSAIYMLQFALSIICQMLLSSASSFSTKLNAEAVDRLCDIPLRPIFNGAKPAHLRKEKVEIADITNHNRTLVCNKENNRRNMKITSSEIKFSSFSPEALVIDELLG